MDKRIAELESRVSMLESGMDAAIGVINRLVEDIYDPEVVKKLDKLAMHGQE